MTLNSGNLLFHDMKYINTCAKYAKQLLLARSVSQENQNES